MAAPRAVEAIRFRTLCYFDPTVTWGAIGGNICLIEVKAAKSPDIQPAKVFLTFIHGAELKDPHRLLTGAAKHKRIVPIPTVAFACHPHIRALIAASAVHAASRSEA